MFLKGCIGACNNHANGLKKMHFSYRNKDKQCTKYIQIWTFLTFWSSWPLQSFQIYLQFQIFYQLQIFPCFELFKVSSNVSTTPITAMECGQYLPISVVQLKGKHCQKTHCCNGVVDTFGPSRLCGPCWPFGPHQLCQMATQNDY